MGCDGQHSVHSLAHTPQPESRPIIIFFLFIVFPHNTTTTTTPGQVGESSS